jgi:hypothetical protein
MSASRGPGPGQHEPRRVLAVAALAATSALASAALGELALRLVAPQPASWLAIYRRHPELPFHGLLPDTRAWLDTGEKRWAVLTDGQGFRVGGSPRTAPTCSALWLGDSFAFGHGVDWGDSIVGLLEARVPEVRQVNAAVPGYGPVQYRQVLEQLLRKGMDFDFVFVVTYVGNDFHDCLWNKDVSVHEGVIGHHRDLKSWLKNELHLYRLASAAYHRLVPARDSPYQRVLDELRDPDAWASGPLAGAGETFAREMARIRELGRSRGADVRFVVVPTREAVAAARDAGPDGTSRALLPVAKARSLLEGIDAAVFDATDALAARPAAELYFPFDGHLNREGNRRVAEGLLAAWPLVCPRDRNAP